MRTKISLYTALLALSATVMSPAAAVAQEVKVVSINVGTTAGGIKAEILNAGDRKVTGATGRAFYMPTGKSTRGTRFGTFSIDGHDYVSAELVGTFDNSNNYFYRIEVTFDDGTTAKSDMFNAAMTEGAVWLSDLPYTKTPEALEVGIDRVPDGREIEIHKDSIFHKGVSIRYPVLGNGQTGTVTFTTQRKNQYNAPFIRSQFTMGLQAYAADGSASDAYTRIIYMLNGAETGSRATMYSYSNPLRRNAAYFFDQTQSNASINTVGFRMTNQTATTSTDNCYGNLAACRLYYTVPTTAAKQTQTVTFDTPGGMIYEEAPEVELGAFATGGTPIIYSIIQGRDIATLVNIDGTYYLRPLEGKKGDIVVEAITMGNDTYAPASATQTYTFNFASTVEYLYTHRNAEDPKQQTLYFFVDHKGRALEKLEIDIYDNVRSLSLLRRVDIVADGLSKYATPIEHIYAIDVTVPDGGSKLVHQLDYKFAGFDEEAATYCEGRSPFVYLTDIPGMADGIIIEMEEGTPAIDEAYGGGQLANTKYTYAKGYGVHAAGYLETPTTFDLTPYSRFCVDVSGQELSGASATRGRIGYSLFNGVSKAYLTTGATSWKNVFEWDFPIQSYGDGKTIKLQFDAGGDGNTDDAVCIGAPRFYYSSDDPRHPQTLEWISEETINPYRTPSVVLSATTTSGLPIFYRIARGSEFATIVDGNTLRMNLDAITAHGDAGGEAELLIEAFQPGNKDYQAATPLSCRIYLRKTVFIHKNERIELESSHQIDELVIYADGNSAGQAVVTSGVINVKRLVLKYTFTPGLWHHIAFPADLDLMRISDFEENGFQYAAFQPEGVAGLFYLREYNSKNRADFGESTKQNENPWQVVDSPRVQAHKGYIMKLETEDNKPVEITFVMNNISLDFQTSVRAMYLSVDMSNCVPESRHTVYISPKNVDGNTLRVDLRYVPDDISSVPVNHQYALEQMRITRTPVRGKIRLMLPDQSACRVGIYDRKGKKLLKAVNYVAPMQIDISDLKPGQYLMTVAYGPAYREMLVEL